MLIVQLAKVKGGESEWFKIDNGAGVYHAPLAVQCIYG